MDAFHNARCALRSQILSVPTPDADTMLAWQDALEALKQHLPTRPDLHTLSPPAATAALQQSIEQIRLHTGVEQRLLPPMSLDTLADPATLMAHVHVHPNLPDGMYARSQPYRGRIEISPPSNRFLDPRYHLEGLCDGRLVLELRALQHELVHLHQVDARRELRWLVVMCLVPVLWPVLAYLLFARLVAVTAVHVLAAQEIQAHLHEQELDVHPAAAAARTIIALAPYPFTRHLRVGELEELTALIQALRAMGEGPESLARMLQRLPPRRGIARLSAAVRRRCVQGGWDQAALRRVVRRQALLQELDQLHMQAIARNCIHQTMVERTQ